MCCDIVSGINDAARIKASEEIERARHCNGSSSTIDNDALRVKPGAAASAARMMMWQIA